MRRDTSDSASGEISKLFNFAFFTPLVGLVDTAIEPASAGLRDSAVGLQFPESRLGA